MIMMPIRRNETSNWMPSIFSDFFDNDWMFNRMKSTSPAVNVIENENDYKIEVAAPGMTKEDFHVQLNDDNQLVISMEKKNENTDNDKKYLRREFSYSKFQQALILPEDVEKEQISASVNDGVLTISLPKKQQEERKQENRIIEIQ
jgi:HSP20 family protein